MLLTVTLLFLGVSCSVRDHIQEKPEVLPASDDGISLYPKTRLGLKLANAALQERKPTGKFYDTPLEVWDMKLQASGVLSEIHKYMLEQVRIPGSGTVSKTLSCNHHIQCLLAAHDHFRPPLTAPYML